MSLLSVFGGLGIGLLGSVTVEAGAFARTELAGGVAPEAPGSEPEPTATVELRPGAGLRLRTPRAVFLLQASPRFYYRRPNLGDVERPLILGQTSLSHTYEASRRVIWTTTATANYGELDYTSTQLAFRTPVVRDRLNPIITTRNVDGRSAVEWMVTPLYTLAIAGVAGYSRLTGGETFGDSTEMEPATGQQLPETMTLGFDLSQRWQLDPLSTLTIPISPRFYSVDPDPDSIAVATQAEYERRLSGRDTLIASAGFTILKEEREDTEFLPRGGLSLTTLAYQRPGARLTNAVGLSFDAVLDPTLGELRPFAQLTWSLRGQFGTRWEVVLSTRASTTATTDPLPQAPVPEGEPELVQLATSETDLGASLIAAYRAASWARIDFGVRSSTQGTHWNADKFEFIDEQVWIFSGLTFLFGLGSRQTPDWL